jgi:putative transposase
MSTAYASSLTRDQWDLLSALLPGPKATGRPRTVALYDVVNAIFYLLTTGCAWGLLPDDFPPYSTVYYYFRQWKKDGTWKRVHDPIVEWVRVVDDRPKTPSAGALDSQSVPTAVMVSQAVGFDGGKKIKGRKRFTLVDTLGLLLAVKVVAASTPEREGAKQLLQTVKEEQERLPRLTRIWVDGGFSGVDFLKTVIDLFGLILEVVLRPQGKTGFVLLPRRWVVERSYGGLHWCRRLNVDYERLPESSEALIYIAMIRVMLRRLA